MRVEMWSGTPSHHHTFYGDTQARVKNWLLAELKKRIKWAEHYNLALKAELEGFKEQIGGINVQTMKVGSTREWSATDEHTKVVFVFGLTKLEN